MTLAMGARPRVWGAADQVRAQDEHQELADDLVRLMRCWAKRNYVVRNGAGGRVLALRAGGGPGRSADGFVALSFPPYVPPKARGRYPSGIAPHISRSSKPAGPGSPRVGRFDSFAAPLSRSEHQARVSDGSPDPQGRTARRRDQPMGTGGGGAGWSAGGGAGAGCASTWTLGSHVSQCGRYQLRSPSIPMIAGMMTRRTMVASSSSATATPKPICWKDTSWPVAKPAKTTMMISAAPVISRAVEATPCTIPSWVSPVLR